MSEMARVCGDALENEMDSMDYEVLAMFLAKNKISFEIPNKHINHAAALNNCLFSCAEKTIHMVTGKFPDAFYTKIRNKLVAAIHNSIDVNIIKLSGSFPAELLNLAKKMSNLHLFEASDELLKNIDSIRHFTVADGAAYRFENTHDLEQDFDKNQVVNAFANFNDPTNAAMLTSIFSDLVGQCDAV